MTMDATGTGKGRRRVGVLISGRGSNMMALVEAARRADFPAEIVLVLSNRPDAAGLAWARIRPAVCHLRWRGRGYGCCGARLRGWRWRWRSVLFLLAGDRSHRHGKCEHNDTRIHHCV